MWWIPAAAEAVGGLYANSQAAKGDKEEKKQLGGRFGDFLNPFNDKGEKDAFEPGRAYSKDLESRWNAYENALKTGDYDSLGIPWAQQQQAIGAAARQASAGQQAAVEANNRAALAGQGFQSGAFANAANNMTDQGSSAAAQAASQQANLSAQMIAQKEAALRQELTGLRDFRSDQVYQYLQMALQAAAEMQKAGAGGGGGGGGGLPPDQGWASSNGAIQDMSNGGVGTTDAVGAGQ